MSAVLRASNFVRSNNVKTITSSFINPEVQKKTCSLLINNWYFPLFILKFMEIFQGVTLSGQKLTDVDLSGNNISEVLRILIKSRLSHSDDVSLPTPLSPSVFRYLSIIVNCIGLYYIMYYTL